MKKIIAIIVCIALLLVGTACTNNSKATEETEYKDTIPIPEIILPEIESPKISLGNINKDTLNTDDEWGDIVYVSKYGKIHTNPNCSGMKYYNTMTYSAARKQGYTHCQNCY